MMYEIENMIMEFFRKNPDTGLYDVSAWIYIQDPSVWQRNADPPHACRHVVQKRIEKLKRFGYLNQKSDGKRAVYTVKDIGFNWK